MHISLIKGQKIDLTKTNKELDYLYIGIDWKSLDNLDIDASAFLLDENGKVTGDEDFIFYGQSQSKNRSLRLEEAESTIEKQRFIAQLSNIPNEIQKISFALTIYEARLKNLNFSDVRNIKLRIISSKTQEELAVFPIDYTFTKESAIVLGTLYRYSDDWKFHAVGAGFNGGLADLCHQYGLEVIEENGASTLPPISSSPNDRFQVVQERDSLEEGEIIPEQSIEQLELKRSSVIQFDYTRIASLSQQSTNLTQLFEEEAPTDEKATSAERIILSAVSLFDELEEDHEGFIQSLKEVEKAFLKRLDNGEIQISEANLFFRENMTMPAAFLNGVNEKATVHLGENLLLEYKETIIADEEYISIIEKIKERSENEY